MTRSTGYFSQYLAIQLVTMDPEFLSISLKGEIVVRVDEDVNRTAPHRPRAQCQHTHQLRQRGRSRLVVPGR